MILEKLQKKGHDFGKIAKKGNMILEKLQKREHDFGKIAKKET